mmetsp:Transcript_13330/g.24817  ORF Transcript_13330/g.24817 Transcript_13330/m.24817 type:complete len:81 (-) Transcript_13330:368-610(-)
MKFHVTWTPSARHNPDVPLQGYTQMLVRSTVMIDRVTMRSAASHCSRRHYYWLETLRGAVCVCKCHSDAAAACFDVLYRH